MEENKTIAMGTIWAFAAQMGVKLFAFFYLVAITRLLPPDKVGVFSTVLGILGIIYIFSDFGLRGALNRYVPYLYGKNKFGDLKSLVKRTFMFGSIAVLLFSVAIFLLAGTIAGFYGESLMKPVLEIMALWLILQEVFDLCRGVLNGRMLIIQSQGLETLQNLLKIVITIPALYFIGNNVIVLTGSFVMAFVASSIIAVLLLMRETAKWNSENQGESEFKNTKTMLKELVVFGFTVTVVTFFWMVIQNTDRIMIPKLSNAIDPMAEGGIYMVTLGLANLLLIFTASISTIFFPVVSEMFGKGNKEEIVKVTSTSIRWALLLSLPVLAMMIAYPSELLKMFYGALYEKGGLVLAIFSFGLFVRAMSIPVGMVIVAVKKPEVELKVATFAAIVNVVLNFILIPMFGMEGAAIASAISLITISVLLFYFGKKLFGFRLPKQTVKLFITGAIAIGVMLLLRPVVAPILIGTTDANTVVAETMENEIMRKIVKLVLMGILFVLSSIIVYLIGVFAFKVIGEEEVGMMNAALRKVGIPEKWRNKITGFLMPNK